MRKHNLNQDQQASLKKREPVGFRCDDCRRWYPRTKRVIVNEGWFCPSCGEEAQDEFDFRWRRAVYGDD
jgi:rRNA maturation endonuclease Nob1